MKKMILFIVSVAMIFINYYEIKVENMDIKLFHPDEIIIPKINLDQNFYSYKERSVDSGIIYLKESDFTKDFYILAAHSGSADISYFKNINKLEKGDEIELNVSNKTLKYYVEDKYYTKKNGSINVKNEDNILYLTTCDKYNNKRQLIIKCVK